MNTKEDDLIEESSRLIKSSDVLVIHSGAGIGVDSGLSDYRSNGGIWEYKYKNQKKQIKYEVISTPNYLLSNPQLYWMFYNDRINIFNKVTPHKGFEIILEWIQNFDLKYFCVTSNIDGHFQKAGFSENSIHETHGSIYYLQCLKPCCNKIWENKNYLVSNSVTGIPNSIPKCIYCNELARPNVLMFRDNAWVGEKYRNQFINYKAFIDNNCKDRNVVVLEIGAGIVVNTIRRKTEELISDNIKLIRINPKYSAVPKGHIGLSMGALQALSEINERIQKL